MMFKVKLPLLPMFALPVTYQYALAIVHIVTYSGLTVWCAKCHDSAIHFTWCLKIIIKKRKKKKTFDCCFLQWLVLGDPRLSSLCSHEPESNVQCGALSLLKPADVATRGLCMCHYIEAIYWGEAVLDSLCNGNKKQYKCYRCDHVTSLDVCYELKHIIMHCSILLFIIF